MAQARPPKRVKPIVGILSEDPDLMDRAAHHLSQQVGPIDLISDTWDFDFTDYYAAEMGADLKRRFVCMEELVYPDRLGDLKRLSNDLEGLICKECAVDREHRPVNLDPGYITLSSLVLASMKDYSHRVYLGRGVYAQVTLLYEHGAWRSLPWTYPDYASAHYQAFFSTVREHLKSQISAALADSPAKGR